MRNLRRSVIGAYALIAIIAFGHAAADEPLSCPAGAVLCFETDLAAGAIGKGLLAGVFWPLYFSWVAAG